MEIEFGFRIIEVKLFKRREILQSGVSSTDEQKNSGSARSKTEPYRF